MLLVPIDRLETTDMPHTSIEAHLKLLYPLYLGLLKPPAGLRNLTVILITDGHSGRQFVERPSEAITQSQHVGSVTVVLPRLKQTRLISNARSQDG